MAANVSIFLMMHMPQGVPSNSKNGDPGAIIKWIYDGATISELGEYYDKEKASLPSVGHFCMIEREEGEGDDAGGDEFDANQNRSGRKPYGFFSSHGVFCVTEIIVHVTWCDLCLTCTPYCDGG